MDVPRARVLDADAEEPRRREERRQLFAVARRHDLSARHAEDGGEAFLHPVDVPLPGRAASARERDEPPARTETRDHSGHESCASGRRHEVEDVDDRRLVESTLADLFDRHGPKRPALRLAQPGPRPSHLPLVRIDAEIRTGIAAALEEVRQETRPATDVQERRAVEADSGQDPCPGRARKAPRKVRTLGDRQGPRPAKELAHPGNPLHVVTVHPA